MPGFDLHTHTVFSDGTTTLEDNVAMARSAGLSGIAVTDHDTVDHIAPALALADGVEVIPGAEVSAELDERSVHVLGYWFDPTDRDLLDELDRIRGERESRAVKIVARFNELGVPITIERVREFAGDAPIGRPHLAAAVVEVGAAADAQEVFDRWLADGGPAYVAKYAVRPPRAVELIVAAGGVAVLAHPGLFGRTGDGVSDTDVEEMVAVGLAGIEADHPMHTPDQVRRYHDLAVAHGLVVTAGSDFHGDRKDARIGDAASPAEAVDRLRGRVTAGSGAAPPAEPVSARP